MFGRIRQETEPGMTKALTIRKQARKIATPRFVSPVTGMIVDQNSDVVLEGVVEGSPPLTIRWTKNGQELRHGMEAKFEHNHVRLELNHVDVKDAGRYTCTVENEIGNASSTADLVIKKTVFPPVFGKRLQAQIVKKNERVIMEVEITGTPEPTVTWYKNDEPLSYRDGIFKQLGNYFLLIIENADKCHAGKYMVNAANIGGEAQSIADFVVFDPNPNTMIEMHKTIIYENLADKDLKWDEEKDQLPSSELTAEHVATTTIQPSSTLKTLTPQFSPSSLTIIRNIELVDPVVATAKNEESTFVAARAGRSGIVQSTVECIQSETKHEQKFHMKLEHQSPVKLDLNSTTLSNPIQTMCFPDNAKRSLSTENSELMKTIRIQRNEDNGQNVETPINAKDSASSCSELSKGSLLTPGVPEVKNSVSDDSDGIYDIKVDKLTKNYEKRTKFEESVEPRQAPTSRGAAPRSLEDHFSGTEIGIDGMMINFAYNDFKLPKLNTHRAIIQDTTASGSPIHGTLTISRLVAQSESAEHMLSGFDLFQEPPPETRYILKSGGAPKLDTDISTKLKQLYECQKVSGAASHDGSESHETISADGLLLSPLSQKKKSMDLSIEREKWEDPGIEYALSTHERKSDVEETNDGGLRKTDIESSTSLENRSWSTKGTRTKQTRNDNITGTQEIMGKPKTDSGLLESVPSAKVIRNVGNITERNCRDTSQKFKTLGKFIPQEVSHSQKFKASGLAKPPPISGLRSEHVLSRQDDIKYPENSSLIFKGTSATAPRRQVCSIIQLDDQALDSSRAFQSISEQYPLPPSGFHMNAPQASESLKLMNEGKISLSGFLSNDGLNSKWDIGRYHHHDNYEFSGTFLRPGSPPEYAQTDATQEHPRKVNNVEGKKKCFTEDHDLSYAMYMKNILGKKLAEQEGSIEPNAGQISVCESHSCSSNRRWVN